MCYHARSYETFFLSKEIHDYFLYKNSYKTVLAHEKKPKTKYFRMENIVSALFNS